VPGPAGSCSWITLGSVGTALLARASAAVTAGDVGTAALPKGESFFLCVL